MTIGLHFASPGEVLDPAVVLGQRTILTQEEAAILSLPNLVNWWTAGRASASGGVAVLTDIQNNARLSGISGATPAITTVGGHPALKFNADSYMSGPGSVALSNNFTWLVSLQPIGTLVTGAILEGTRAADSNGPTLFQFSDGSIRGSVTAGQQGNSGAATVAAGVNAIVDWSWDGATMTFGKNGVAGATYVPATSGPSLTPDGFLVGASKGGVNRLKAYVYDIIQFNANMRDGVGDHTTQLATAVAKLQARVA